MTWTAWIKMKPVEIVVHHGVGRQEGMPEFTYATDTTKRNASVAAAAAAAAANQDIAKDKVALTNRKPSAEPFALGI